MSALLNYDFKLFINNHLIDNINNAFLFNNNKALGKLLQDR